MKILFDNGTPKPIAKALKGHQVSHARKIGWHQLKNGDLLDEAEKAGYSVLVTTDKNLRYQQNLGGRKIAVVVLSHPQWPVVRLHLDKIAAAVNSAVPGDYIEIEIPVG